MVNYNNLYVRFPELEKFRPCIEAELKEYYQSGSGPDFLGPEMAFLFPLAAAATIYGRLDKYRSISDEKFKRLLDFVMSKRSSRSPYQKEHLSGDEWREVYHEISFGIPAHLFIVLRTVERVRWRFFGGIPPLSKECIKQVHLIDAHWPEWQERTYWVGDPST